MKLFAAAAIVLLSLASSFSYAGANHHAGAQTSVTQ